MLSTQSNIRTSSAYNTERDSTRSLVMFFLFILLLLLAWCCFWIRRKQRYWPDRGVLNQADSLFLFKRKEHSVHYLQRIYKKFKHTGEQFVGIHIVFQPIALLLDLDLVKQVFVKDFESFPSRGLYHNLRDDPLSGNILRLEGEVWRRLRAKLTPTFTSAKMHYMCGSVVKVAQGFSELVTELVQPQTAVLEIRDLCARFTTDVIGLVAFGIECDSLRKPNTEFRLMGDRAFKSFQPFVEFFGNNYPRLARSLGVRAFPLDLNEFYRKIITENIEYREQQQKRRNDFLDIMIELKNNQVEGEFRLTLNEIIAQSFSFFIAGFETASSTMSFCIYELSQNQEIQQRARYEIMQCLMRHDNQLTYECVKDMKYLEQVVSETLRKYPVAPGLKRVARRDYVVPKSKQVIENGVPILLSVYAIHHDPEHYPSPEIFDPMRFTPDAIQVRHPMAYLPFGAGPRMCIAERFGRMQVMIGLAMLLRNFRFSSCAQTPSVLDFDVKEMRLISVKGGISLKVEKI